MPSIDKPKSNSSKKRLGRGLGSLLNTTADDFDQETTQTSSKSTNQNSTKPQNAQQKPVPNKAEVSTQESTKNRILNLAIEKVEPNKTQPRKDFLKEPLKELAMSIKEQGVLQPITVRKNQDKYEIVAGERRWRASQVAGLDSIPAIVIEVDDQKSMELALIENLQREDLNPVEESMGYQLLIDEYNLSQQEVATKVGKSRSSVTNSLRILMLPRDVKEMLRQGLLSTGHGKVLLGVEDPKIQTQLARKSLKKKLSVRALEREILKLKSPKTNKISDLDSGASAAHKLREKLQKKLGTKVKINYINGKGNIQISFYSDEELTNLYEKIID